MKSSLTLKPITWIQTVLFSPSTTHYSYLLALKAATLVDLAVGVSREQFWTPKRWFWREGRLRSRESMHFLVLNITRRPSRSRLGIETHKNHNLFFFSLFHSFCCCLCYTLFPSKIIGQFSNKHVIRFFPRRGNYSNKGSINIILFTFNSI
jgi:hypothetical protein